MLVKDSGVSPRPSPYDGFVSAARRAVHHLHEVLGLDLWLVTWLDIGARTPLSEPLLARLGSQQQAQDQQIVVAAAGPLADHVPVGVGLDWSRSFCRHLVEDDGPSVAPAVSDVPGYAALVEPTRSHGLGTVHTYLGTPIRGAEGTVLGTVCGYGFAPIEDSSQRVGGQLLEVRLTEEHLGFTAALLASVVTSDQWGLRRAEELRAAVAAAERDPVTGLPDRHGWDSAVAYEHQRGLRYETPTSVVVLRFDVGEAVPDPDAVARTAVVAAQVVSRECRPGDVLARTGDHELSVLAVEADILAVSTLASCLHAKLQQAGLPARIGLATRGTGEDLRLTTGRAGAALEAR